MASGPLPPRQLVSALLAALGPAEIGQDVAVAPAGRAQRLPAVEVERVAADVDEAVDRGRPAQHLAARAGDAPSGEMRLRLRPVGPTVLRHVERDGEGGRHLDQHRPVRATELQHADAVAPVRAQPIRQDAAGRACAYDHVVEFVRGGHRVSAAAPLHFRPAPHDGSRAPSQGAPRILQIKGILLDKEGTLRRATRSRRHR